MALKMVKNHKNYTKIFDIFGKIFGNKPTFGLSVSVKNIPNYSCFGYWFSRYIFPKKLEILKLLPKRMALLQSREMIYLKLVSSGVSILNGFALPQGFDIFNCAVHFVGLGPRIGQASDPLGRFVKFGRQVILIRFGNVLEILVLT